MSIFVLFFYVFFVINVVDGRCENEDKRNTFLWSVRHPESSSRGYLFGTIHVPYTEVWNEVSDRVREAFSFSDTVLLEVNLRDEATIRRLIRCKNLRRKQTARSYLPSKLYSRIENLMLLFQKSLFQWAQQRQNPNNGEAFKRAEEIYDNISGDWQRKRPEWLLFLLYQMCENVFDRPTSPMLDLYLAQKAAEDQKMIIAIETTEEQCNPINSVTDEELIFAIQYTVSYLEKIYSKDSSTRLIQNKKTRSISELVKHYKCGTLEEKIFDTPEIIDSNSEDKKKADLIDKKLKQDIIVRRNARMANRLNSMLNATQNKIIFSAIGTGHFFGNHSVLNHLKNQGYVIEEIDDDDIITPSIKNLQRQKTFNSMWTRRRPLTEDSITIEFIEKPNSAFANFHNYLFLIILLIYYIR